MRHMRKWARIRGAYRLSRRSLRRIVAAIAAALLAFHTATAALSPQDDALRRRALAAMGSIAFIENVLPPGEACVAVSDCVFEELAELFILFRPMLAQERRAPARRFTAPPPAAPPRRYAARKAISIARTAAITGLSESTIKRLDKDPGNTNYPGRNSTAKILAAWARLHRENNLAAREVRAANRPRLGLGRG